MANRKLSELNALTSDQVTPNDLFLISDVSAFESKKITADELRKYASSGSVSTTLNGTASFANTASWAINAVSASYALSASYAMWATTASYAISASYALSSSFSQNSFRAVTASYALTASVQLVISSGMANYADSASYLIYTVGRDNGTASYALVTSNALKAAYADYLNYTGVPNGTASFALTASQVLTASYLSYTGKANGTASYALNAKNSDNAVAAVVATTVTNANIYREYDPLNVVYSSSLVATFGTVQFDTSAGSIKMSLEAWGDVMISPTTGSANTSSVALQIIPDTLSAITMDQGTFQLYLTGSSTTATGAQICGFRLKGTAPVSPIVSAYKILVSGSNMTFYTGSRNVQCVLKATSDLVYFS